MMTNVAERRDEAENVPFYPNKQLGTERLPASQKRPSCIGGHFSWRSGRFLAKLKGQSRQFEMG